LSNLCEHKYLPKSKTGKRWCSAKFAGDDARRNKYYAYLKHRSQAQFRGESYELTFAEWEHLWPEAEWQRRGRAIDDFCITRRDFDGEWAVHNVIICTRRDHFKIKHGTYADDE